jgi:hypothetical protein
MGVAQGTEVNFLRVRPDGVGGSLGDGRDGGGLSEGPWPLTGKSFDENN